MNISKHYQDYLSFMDDQARDQLQTETGHLQELSFSKKFLHEKEGQIESKSFKQLECELLGAGPIESLLADPTVTEIIVNSFDQIYFEKEGQLQKLQQNFSCEASYHNTIERICHEAGVELNSHRPHCDGLWRGFRVHMLGQPLSVNGTKICLRRNSKNSWNLKKLQEAHWCTEQEALWLRTLVKDKANVLVIGPTNTGKTTCINACLQNIEENERVVFIEDTDELALPTEVSVKLLTRSESENQLKAYDQQDLLHQSLRMRPDRIVVGEVRGSEAKDYLMALATGHRGAWCSLHAESPRQALHRLELLIQMTQPQWKSSSVRQLIKMGIDFIVSLENKNGRRKLSAIHQITSLESTGFCMERLNECD